ncbi:hypothetical protein P152DRAFT_168442 [Eremomyces bilateralis CBS 781.70]|uniref:Protein kinase domain-containing protein n=1 Tax=Eremomyces bilateralis CBS 781.70 TaxID=1392243 RepID=A0A6G1FU32_9PEZI|nr:uncharacterized protein P152DRAFT_168442 [Eremomyces bilateralis CBS 781.70]KAF1809307.1 hypothetical protein P152DRAFT_168442 [Eremomyces bilateralis CBS 781.70]
MVPRTISSVVTPNTIALNAFIFGYAGHSLVTPHAPLQQLWWTDERIDSKVTPELILSRVRPDQRVLLRRPLAFGDSLTNDCYLDWILKKARRWFMILEDLGIPDRIFAIVDDSFDDDDLPIPEDTVPQLKMSVKPDHALFRRFYNTQFTFLLRELKEGSHIDYAHNEFVPIEYVHRLPPAVALQDWYRVHFPKRPHEVFVRRKVSLKEPQSSTALEEEFIADVRTSRSIVHPHIAPIYASYTFQGDGYTITTFSGQHTLQSFISHRNPPQYQRLAKPDRHRLLLGWMHCLADALIVMHQNGLCHAAIRPSNVVIDSKNSIAFSDIGCLRTFQRDKKANREEEYTYSAPELQVATRRQSQPALTSIKSPSFRLERASNTSTSSSDRCPSVSTSSTTSTSSRKSTSALTYFRTPRTSSLQPVVDPPIPTPHSDIFSLGCLFLDLLSFLLKQRPADFLKHRATKLDADRPKSKGPSRVDASFHANVPKLLTWMDHLEGVAATREHRAFRAVPALLRLCRRMVSPLPEERPSARETRDRVAGILVGHVGMAAEGICCYGREHEIGMAITTGG